MNVKLYSPITLIILCGPAVAGWFGPSNFMECFEGKIEDLPYYADAKNVRAYLKCLEKFPPDYNAKEIIERARENVKKAEATQKYFEEHSDDPEVKKIIQEEKEQRDIESRAIQRYVKEKYGY